MTFFNRPIRCSASAHIQQLSKELAFLDGRTERYESLTVRVEKSDVSLTVKIGDHEKHSLTYYPRDNAWALSIRPREPWEDWVVTTEHITALAKRTFLQSVVYSLRACKQLGGAPMIDPAEETRLFASIVTERSQKSDGI